MTTANHRAGPRVSAVIFDCDGTLVDSEALALDAMARLATEHGLAADHACQLATMRGEAMSTCLAFIASKLPQPMPLHFEDSVRARMADAFRAALRPMPDALLVVERIGLPICVATNGPRSRAELTLGITGLLPFFEGRIYSAVEVGSYKPQPDLFLFAAAALGVAPARCAVVEDSEPGMRAGLAAGMEVYSVRSTHPLPPELLGRVRLLDRLGDLPTAIGIGQKSETDWRE